MTGYSWQANREKDLVSVKLGQFFVDSYLAKTDPAVASTFFCDRLELTPPLLVQMRGVEGPLDSTVAFVERARAAGVDVDLEVYTGMPHNFAKFRTPICAVAYARMGRWTQGGGGPRIMDARSAKPGPACQAAHRYDHLVRLHRYDEVASLFAEDAEWFMPTGAVTRGRTTIGQAFEAYLGDRRPIFRTDNYSHDGPYCVMEVSMWCGSTPKGKSNSVPTGWR